MSLDKEDFILKKERERKKLLAVHSNDLETYLKNLELWDKLKSGDLTCYFCASTISLDNFQGLFPLEGEIELFCSDIGCYRKLMDRRGDKNG